MKYVLFYESADDVAEKAPVHFAEHKARWQEFLERGSLLLIGPFSDGSGAMAVFTTMAAAEEFRRGRPVRAAWRHHELVHQGVDGGDLHSLMPTTATDCRNAGRCRAGQPVAGHSVAGR